VQSHLTCGELPTFGPVTTRLVGYGIARLRDRNQGEIVEPLAFLSLMKWLETNRSANLETGIRARLSFQASRRSAYEELVVLYLLRALRYPTPFTAVFNFHGTPPTWAEEMAQIVGPLDGINVPVDVIGDAPQVPGPGPGVVHYATNIQDVLHWIEGPSTAPAVLIPGSLFGPDVVIRCRSSPLNSASVPREVLVMGHLKSSTEGNKAFLDAKTMDYAMTSLTRDHWSKLAVRHLVSLLSSAF
jgi:hypothetical protein